MDRVDVFELIGQAAACDVPDALRARGEAIAREASWYHERIRDGHAPVYGATTLTGHLDATRVPLQDSPAIQRRIIDSHCIGSAPFHSPATARLVGHAKAHAVAAGGSGLSPGIYAHLLDALADPGFAPRIPVCASYSCGDVIPAAHWARALLDHGDFAQRGALQAGDALALVNGSFVDLGVSLSLVLPLRDAVVACVANSRAVARAWPQQPGPLLETAAPEPVRALLRLVAEASDGDPLPRQAEVSIRATPQLLVAVLSSATALVRVLAEELTARSANPLVSMQAQRIDSQASFMSPRLAIAKSALAEAVLFASWACQGRIGAVTRRLEAGAVPGVDALDVVQFPKLTQALLEESRLRLGRRLFASGSGTSQGIEDLWTFGTLASAQLEHGIATWARMEAKLSLLLRLLAAGSPALAKALLQELRGGEAAQAGASDTPASLYEAVTVAMREG